MSDSSNTYELLDRIRRAVLLENVSIEGRELEVTVSIGGVEVESRDLLASHWQEYLAKADNALYQVKSNAVTALVLNLINP
ncbi:hypothetical protein AS132_08230 [Photobacterium sanguinicancri]|nr:hypothetical protein AS132_08230 [Photobacterium sanguinicancri]